MDAVDEIQSSDGIRTGFLAGIFDLQKETEINIFATSRFDADFSRTFKDNDSSSLEIRALGDDVRSYIDGQVETLPRFISENAELKRQIKEQIVEAVDGMSVH